jgi:D-alanyl-D-alanine carboxypeptidase
MTESRPYLIPLIVILFAGILVLFSVAGKNNATPEKELGFVATKLLRPAPELSAHAHLVGIMGEKWPLLKQREWKPLAPASLSKLMTAVLAEDYLPPLAPIIFSETAKSMKEDGEKMSKVDVGEILTKEDVIKLLLIASANDAATALAEMLGGEDQFQKLASQKAREIGLKNSQFVNPTGLDEDGHYTTAEDLARLAAYIWQNHPSIWEITRLKEAVIFSEPDHEYTVETTNKLLAGFPGILGGKTGFTDDAKESLILLYPVRPDKVAIIVILRSDNRFEDARKIIKWLENGI